ncbi:hypothetical protein Hanom_Chr14g01255191 [Helianthus anomalus]
MHNGIHRNLFTKSLLDRNNKFFNSKNLNKDNHLKGINKFKALGWEASLKCYENDDNHLFADEIVEWMATLTCSLDSKASAMKLLGTVNGIDATMSFETLSSWQDLKHNVIPRRVDKVDVRYSEVLVLYTLIHEKLLIPFQY